MIVVPAAIIVLGIYIFQGLSITAPAQTQTIEWIKVIPYIIVLGTAIAGMNVMLVLIIGILTSGIIGIATGSFGIFDWFGAMGTGITGMGELIIITLLAGGMLETIRYLHTRHSRIPDRAAGRPHCCGRYRCRSTRCSVFILKEML